MINVDSYIEHERLQATIHGKSLFDDNVPKYRLWAESVADIDFSLAMRSFLSYKIGSPEHSLIISRINEHHHRYGIL